jgi:predicted DNA-binding transcriptional regulator AlpA
MEYSELQQYRPATVAKLLGISIATFWRLVRDKKLVTKKISERTTVVSAKDLQAFIASFEC